MEQASVCGVRKGMHGGRCHGVLIGRILWRALWDGIACGVALRGRDSQFGLAPTEPDHQRRVSQYAPTQSIFDGYAPPEPWLSAPAFHCGCMFNIDNGSAHGNGFRFNGNNWPNVRHLLTFIL
jgi:hypothetical protein